MKFFTFFLCTLLFLSVSYELKAQENQQSNADMQQVEENVEEAISYLDRKFNFGVKAGLNFSTFNDAEKFNADTQTQLHLGVFTRYRFTKRLSAKAELLYSMKGSRADEFSIFEEYSVDLGYISLPVMAEFGINDRWSLELGPYIAVLVSTRQSFHELQGNREMINISEDETNFVDVGVGGGVVYNTPTGFGFGLRYSQGVADALGKDFFRSASGSNSVIQLSGYYHF